ncbi:MAG: SMP-30/gluconolactonase/LRE family protein [Fimbriimonadaceae bacterium]
MMPFACSVALLSASMGAEPDSGLAEILAPDAKLETLATGYRFTEGPIWTRRGTLIFSDIPMNRLYEWTPSQGEPKVFREPSNNANGNTLDAEGRLVTCEHGSRRVTRTEADGRIAVLAERFEGKRLNSPNDVAVHPNGTIFFTDPPYGIRPEQAELDFNGVFRLAKDGSLTVIDRERVRPNGIVLSPDRKLLYVADTEGEKVVVYPVDADANVGPGREFASTKVDSGRSSPDGMRVDIKGNLYVATSVGVQVFSPRGVRIGVIRTPRSATNCAFGEDGKTLFVTSQESVYRIRLAVAGVMP